MPQSAAITLTVAVFVIALFLFWFMMFHLDLDSAWVAVGVPFVVLAISITMAFWSFNDNYYDVKSGTVVNQDFTPAHMTPSTIINTGKTITVVPGTWVDDDWAIEVKNSDGVEGWIHFSSNPFSEYPIGSHYPHN
ncbi:MAG TPA: hypothetical protein VFQ70_00780 [Candidatus Saccharimonadaceae bacterium]|nr:hypothetical protein [Candidatus Saccharimonadaceae bacterium]